MKKGLLILMLIVVNLTGFASYVEICEITGILTEDTRISRTHVSNINGDGRIDFSLSLKMKDIEIKKSEKSYYDYGDGYGHNYKEGYGYGYGYGYNFNVETGKSQFVLRSENLTLKDGKPIGTLKKGQKIRFKKGYIDKIYSRPELHFYDIEIIK